MEESLILIPQIFLNSICTAFWYSMLGMSFYLIFKTHGYINITIASFYMLGAYFALFFHKFVHIPILLACIASVCCVMLLGIIFEYSIFDLLRKRKASSIISLLSSFGIYIVVQNLISVFFGDETKILRSTSEVSDVYSIFNINITLYQIYLSLFFICFYTIITIFFKRSSIAKKIIALSSDSELSFVVGINVRQIQVISFALSAGIASIAGIWVSLDTDMVPSMGLDALLFGIVASLIGGACKISSIFWGAIFLSTVQNIAIWYIGTDWYEAIAFFILLLLLLVKPEGFFGKKSMKVRV